MKHLCKIPWIVLVVGLCAACAPGNVIVFEENEDNGSSEYEWEANNWFVPAWNGGPEYRVPASGDAGRLGTDRECLIDGQTAAINTLDLGYDSSGDGTLTIDSGSLRVYSSGVSFRVGAISDGTLNLNAGTITVDSDTVHGGFVFGYGNSVQGTMNQTGGTVNAVVVTLGRSRALLNEGAGR